MCLFLPFAELNNAIKVRISLKAALGDSAVSIKRRSFKKVYEYVS